VSTSLKKKKKEENRCQQWHLCGEEIGKWNGKSKWM